MKLPMRPTTKRMIEKLGECHEKELTSGEKIPSLPEEMKSSLAGLYKRGLIETRMEIIKNNYVYMYRKLERIFLDNWKIRVLKLK